MKGAPNFVAATLGVGFAVYAIAAVATPPPRYWPPQFAPQYGAGYPPGQWNGYWYPPPEVPETVPDRVDGKAANAGTDGSPAQPVPAIPGEVIAVHRIPVEPVPATELPAVAIPDAVDAPVVVNAIPEMSPVRRTLPTAAIPPAPAVTAATQSPGVAQTPDAQGLSVQTQSSGESEQTRPSAVVREVQPDASVTAIPTVAKQPSDSGAGAPVPTRAIPTLSLPAAGIPALAEPATTTIPPNDAAPQSMPGVQQEPDAAARNRQAVLAMQAGDYAIAYSIWMPLADAGDAKAQFSLGWMYHNGYGLAIDNRQTLRWWRQAAAHGLKDADFALGLLLSQGDDQVEQDLAAGVGYLLQAAARGHEDARRMLLSLLQNQARDMAPIIGAWDATQWRLLGEPVAIAVPRGNVRDGPSLDSHVVTVLEKGSRLLRLSQQGHWLWVVQADSGRLMWVHDSIIHPLGDQS